MNRSEVQIDHAGRIVLPKRLRDRFGLQSGDTLAIEERSGRIELYPIRTGSHLEMINGVLVLKSAVPLEQRDLALGVREERISALARETKGRQ